MAKSVTSYKSVRECHWRPVAAFQRPRQPTKRFGDAGVRQVCRFDPLRPFFLMLDDDMM